MADRITVKSNIQGLNVPTVSNDIMNDILDEVTDNVVFKEDVAVAQAGTLSNLTITFAGKDRVDLDTTNIAGTAVNISVNTVGDGQTVYILITKNADQVITFTGITDITPNTDYVTIASVVLYKIIRKNTYYYAEAVLKTIADATDTYAGILKIATAQEHKDLSLTNKVCVPGRLPEGIPVQKGLVKVATDTDVSNGNYYDDGYKTVHAGQLKSTNDRVTNLESVPEILAVGETTIGDIFDEQEFTITHNLKTNGKIVNAYDYVIFITVLEATLEDGNINILPPIVHLRNVNNFVIRVAEIQSTVQNLTIMWQCVKS